MRCVSSFAARRIYLPDALLQEVYGDLGELSTLQSEPVKQALPYGKACFT